MAKTDFISVYSHTDKSVRQPCDVLNFYKKTRDR